MVIAGDALMVRDHIIYHAFLIKEKIDQILYTINISENVFIDYILILIITLARRILTENL